MQTWAEWGHPDPGLERAAVGVRTWITGHVSMETEWHRYFESREDGGHDTLNVGFTHLGIGAPITAQGQVRVLIGVATYHDDSTTINGPSLGVAVDVFPISPLILSAQIHSAQVGGNEERNSIAISSYRATLGCAVKRVEPYGGWQSVTIGHTTPLEGPVAGIRLWF